MELSKNNKKPREKTGPNIIVFLVEGDSDRIALDTPLSELIFNKHPDYEVRFLQQERLVNNKHEEVDDPEEDDDIDDTEEYQTGGDITSSSYVTPQNIETKIYRRFILPAIKREGIYPKRIAKVIQIVDLDGVYLHDDSVLPFSKENETREKTFYDGQTGIIQCADVNMIRERNANKRANLDYLISLPDGKIKLGSKSIPFEIYFFSSNLDHYLYNEANMNSGKKRQADNFLRTIGLDSEAFSKFFLEDPSAIGHLGYKESWDMIRQESTSVMRHTNIDYLILQLASE